MRKLLFIFGILLLSANAYAQTATPSSKLVWDYPNVSLSAAQAFGELYYVDSGSIGTTLTGKTCSITGTLVTCQSPFPALTPGTHSLQIASTSGTATSDKSNSVSFTFIVLVTPSNLRISKNNVFLFPHNLNRLSNPIVYHR